MHESSIISMKEFFSAYIKEPWGDVLDIGARGNDSYRKIARDNKCTYVGLDIIKGDNVDIVPKDPYDWKEEIGPETFSIVISGQAFEHIEFFWLTFKEMVRVLKPGGYICLIVPSRGYYHNQPVDCWRFYGDSMAALAKWGNIKLIRADITDPSAVWGDNRGVFRKETV